MRRHRATDELIQAKRRPQVPAFVEPAGRQAGPVGEHTAALDAATQQHRRRRLSMIGAAGTVDRDRPAEFGRDQHHRVAPQRAHAGRQCANHRVQAFKLRRQSTALARMRIPAPGLDRRDAGAVVGHQQPRRQRARGGSVAATILRQVAGQVAGAQRLVPQLM